MFASAPTSRAVKAAQASLVMAMTIPISTNTIIAVCNQIQVGDILRRA
jgi:hypothetical protein